MNTNAENFSSYARQLRGVLRVPAPPPRPPTAKSRQRHALVDPQIDAILSLIDESEASDSRIASECGVHPHTLVNWRKGRVARPSHLSIALILAALGKRFVIVDV